jgi:hypothetical protein
LGVLGCLEVDTMRRTARRGTRWLTALLALALAVPAAGQETRRLRRIERPTPTAQLYQGPAVPPPTREQCETAVRRIAADYGPGGLEPHLALEFPYREELLDALERVALEATRIELRVESVEGVEIEPWRLAATGPARAGQASAGQGGGGATGEGALARPGGTAAAPGAVDGEATVEGPAAPELFADCIADVRTRLAFDDARTGLRTVRDVGRAQWRVRFYAVAPEVEP